MVDQATPTGFTLEVPSEDSMSKSPPKTSEDSEWTLVDDVAHKLHVEGTLERNRIGFKASKIAAVLSAAAPTIGNTSRAPLRLVAVLDKSGSMRGNKLRLVVKTMNFMLRHLSECDALGLVEYDSNVKVIAPLTKCNADGRVSLEAALQRVREGTQTNLSGGLLRGLELHKGDARTAGESAAVQRIVIGNTYRQLPDDEKEFSSSSGVPVNGHEWTMELRFDCPEDAALVQKVTYTLHESFKIPVVDISEGPNFRLTRKGWGTFKVKATLCLLDGRTIDLTHDLTFGETFCTVWQPLRLAIRAAPPADAQSGLVRSTFLFTDGLANQGITDIADLCDAARAVLDELSDRRCALSTFGFGKDHSPDMLMKLAEVGSGTYSFIENEDQIGAAFGEALGGLLSTTHQNVRLCLELGPGVHMARACTEYPTDTQTSDAGVVSVEFDLGDFFAEERRDILVELNFPEDSSELEEENRSLEVAKLSARGFSVFAKRSESTAPMVLEVTRCADADVEADGSCNVNVERPRCRYLTTQALRDARALAERGDLIQARQRLKETLQLLEKSVLAGQGDSLCLGFIADLNECFDDLRDRQAYASSGSKKMGNYYMAHTKMRAMNMEGTEVYSNGRQFDMKCAFRNATKSVSGYP